MKRIFTAILIAAVMATPLMAETRTQNGQLEQSVQQGLNHYGFNQVDAGTLTNQQLAALHLKFSNSVGSFGLASVQRKQEIKVILGWNN